MSFPFTENVIVAPTYLQQMTGVAAIRVSARKIYLCDAMLKTIKSCSRKSTDDLAGMSFTDIVETVDVRHFLATA